MIRRAISCTNPPGKTFGKEFRSSLPGETSKVIVRGENRAGDFGLLTLLVLVKCVLSSTVNVCLRVNVSRRQTEIVRSMIHYVRAGTRDEIVRGVLMGINISGSLMKLYVVLGLSSLSFRDLF